jgi:3-deoxy-manno-octulosonate cytidylyltransferase (CMP-KDO synthetase)
MKRTVLAVIPARLNSKRFAGKIVCSYRGKPLLSYVWQEVREVGNIDRLLIATDSDRVIRAARAFGAEVIRTSARHRTGSDRVAEVAERVGGDIVVNVQADNFGLKRAILERAIERMKRDRSMAFATLAHRIKSDGELFDPAVVKVVLSKAGEALWFSRFPVPYVRDADDRQRADQFKFYEHIGVYFFRRTALRAFARWKRSALERAESLEQLRILENGGRIRVFKTVTHPVSVDGPDDLAKLAAVYC